MLLQKRKRRPQEVEQKCPQGTDDVEQLIQEAQESSEMRLAEVVKNAKKKLTGGQVMPLDHDMVMAYKTMETPGAKKDDERFYRDGIFHEDEQAQKTEQLDGDVQELEGLDDPDDPGFWPPIMYESEEPTKQPAYTTANERTGLDTFVFPFTWNQIGPDFTIAVMGKRRSGKTRFILSMLGLYLRPFFPRIVVFTKTKCSGEYSKHIPEAYIVEGFDENVLKALFALQKVYKTKSKEGKFHGNMNLLVVIDDCLSDGFKHKKTVDEVFFEGRHLDVCFVISTQDMKGINPACTGNTDLAVAFNLRSERDKEALRTKYCDFFRNNDEMEELTNLVTHRKWHAVIFDQHLPHRDPRFTIFCGRAPDPPPFVMGCKAWWRNNPKQLLTIIQENPEELSWLLYTDEWGIIGEEEFNDIM